ncbi:MAG: GldM family protein [Chitinophagaceae bacterium]|nr:GldM family protein [Chitinophagaceae bacterium]
MKLAALFFALLFFQQHPSGQLECVVAITKENVLYIGIDNPIEVLIERTSKNAVFIKSNNGYIENHGGNNFIIRPHRRGFTEIEIFRIFKRDTLLVCTRLFRVKELPLPVGIFGNLRRPIVSKRTIKIFGGLRAVLEDSEYDLPIEVKEYSVIITRDTAVVGISKNIGPRYNTKTELLLQNLQPGDNIYVTNIIVNMGYELRRILPLEYTVTE